MCKPSGKRIEIKNVSYEICLDCGMPIRGTGLSLGGMAIFVLKDFIRKGKRVDFCGDWRRLCESVGFKTLHEHHASLVQEDVKDSLFGHKIVKRKDRKSFFRRLAESKGSPRIDYETVLCMEKQ